MLMNSAEISNLTAGDEMQMPNIMVACSSVSFTIRILPFVNICWVLEYNIAPKCILNLQNQDIHSWLHPFQNLALFLNNPLEGVELLEFVDYSYGTS